MSLMLRELCCPHNDPTASPHLSPICDDVCGVKRWGQSNGGGGVTECISDTKCVIEHSFMKAGTRNLIMKTDIMTKSNLD